MIGSCFCNDRNDSVSMCITIVKDRLLRAWNSFAVGSWGLVIKIGSGKLLTMVSGVVDFTEKG